MAMAQHARTKRNISCTEHSAMLLTWRARSQRSRATAWQMGRLGACGMPSSSEVVAGALVDKSSRIAVVQTFACASQSSHGCSCQHRVRCWLKMGVAERKRCSLGATQQAVCNRAGDSRAWGRRCARELLRTRAGAAESSTRRPAAAPREFMSAMHSRTAFTHAGLARIRY